MSTIDVLADLAALVGDGVRDATDEDMIDGVQPQVVVTPRTVEETAAVLRLAFGAGLAVVPRGAGTTLCWARPPSRLDILLDMRGMDRILEHAAGDLVVRAEAGTTLARVQETVRAAGQTLALDLPDPGATLGGMVASNVSGPRRFRYGTIRDLIIGITIVLADGTVARSGGKVVKNVAGYDLAKLLTGSFGTLGVIVETIFRLHALPALRQLVIVDLTRPDSVCSAVQAVLHSHLTPVAVDLLWADGEGRLVLALEGTKPGVEESVTRAIDLLQTFGPTASVAPGEAGKLWRQMTEMPWREDDMGIKISSTPTGLPEVLTTLVEGFPDVRISGQVGSGVLYAALPGTSTFPKTVHRLRERAQGAGGALILLHASPELKAAVDPWGSFGDSFPLMRRVKEQFDPREILSPGRFVEGAR